MARSKRIDPEVWAQMTVGEQVEYAAKRRRERFRRRRAANPNEFRDVAIYAIASDLASKSCTPDPGMDVRQQVAHFLPIVRAWFDEHLPIMPVDLDEESRATDKADRELAIAHGLPVGDVNPYV